MRSVGLNVVLKIRVAQSCMPIRKIKGAKAMTSIYAEKWIVHMETDPART